MTTTPRLIVRHSQTSDIPAITSIYAHAVSHGVATFEIDPPDEAEMARRRETILAAGYPYVVAERDGEIVGYAYLNLFRARAAYGFTVEDTIYIRPDAWRAGVGRALLRELIDEAGKRGFREILAVIGDSANTASIKLHAALGFEHAGMLKSVGWKHQQWLDVVMMQLSLPPGPPGGA